MRLVLEAQETIGIGRKGLRQHLNGNIASEPGIARAIHLTHSAGAEQRRDTVDAYLSADHGCSRSVLPLGGMVSSIKKSPGQSRHTPLCDRPGESWFRKRSIAKDVIHDELAHLPPYPRAGAHGWRAMCVVAVSLVSRSARVTRQCVSVDGPGRHDRHHHRDVHPDHESDGFVVLDRSELERANSRPHQVS